MLCAAEEMERRLERVSSNPAPEAVQKRRSTEGKAALEWRTRSFAIKGPFRRS
jgi:hypothetical protein